jgi:hypothetical protein
MASFGKSKESRLVNHPSIIENAGMKFLIFDAPSDENIEAYIEVQTHIESSCPASQFLTPTRTEPHLRSHGDDISH